MGPPSAGEKNLREVELERRLGQPDELGLGLLPAHLREPQLAAQPVRVHARLVVADGTGPAQHLEGESVRQAGLLGHVGQHVLQVAGRAGEEVFLGS